MYLYHAVRSETGSKRRINEDSYRIESYDRQSPAPIDTSMLFAVADGMGGHPCGEVASKAACKALRGFLEKNDNSTIKGLQSDLVNNVLNIDNQLRRSAKKNPACLHMGTTLSVLIIFGPKGIISHVGDTRIYRLRDGKLKLLTTDHTFVQELVEKGALTPEMAANAPHRNVLTQVIGTDESVEVVFTKILDIVPGDRFLLSSDGLHGSVSFQEIETMMMEEMTNPDETAQQLLSQAIANGGHDDITLIVVHTS